MFQGKAGKLTLVLRIQVSGKQMCPIIIPTGSLLNLQLLGSLLNLMKQPLQGRVWELYVKKIRGFR